jgi:hypothetical protein
MSKGKKEKEHRRKVEKRNEKIRQERKKLEKSQQEFLMKLIEEEKQRGLFNSPVMPFGNTIPGIEGPNLGMPNLGIPNGPQI